MSLPAWLPDFFKVSPWHHDTYDLLYKIFHENFIANKTFHQERYVNFSRIITEGKEEAFWHLTTRNEKTQSERFPDPRRCERLPWLKPLLENHQNPEVLTWECYEENSLKIYVWLKDYDYVAILKKPSNGPVFLLTAFWVEFNHTKRKLMKKYNEARNKKANV